MKCDVIDDMMRRQERRHENDMQETQEVLRGQKHVPFIGVITQKNFGDVRA